MWWINTVVRRYRLLKIHVKCMKDIRVFLFLLLFSIFSELTLGNIGFKWSAIGHAWSFQALLFTSVFGLFLRMCRGSGSTDRDKESKASWLGRPRLLAGDTVEEVCGRRILPIITSIMHKSCCLLSTCQHILSGISHSESASTESHRWGGRGFYTGCLTWTTLYLYSIWAGDRHRGTLWQHS